MSSCCFFALSWCGFAVKGRVCPLVGALVLIVYLCCCSLGASVVCAVFLPVHLVSSRRRRKSLKVEPPDISGGSVYFIFFGSSMIPNK